ncbi:hypothetical protein C0993_005322, partial [Termitomyces sp. T159_Od127]
CKEPIEPWDSVPALVPHQEEELNVASNILKAFNSAEDFLISPLPAPLASQHILMQTPSPALSTSRVSPLKSLHALTLLSNTCLLKVTMPTSTLPPTSTNLRHPAADQPLLAEFLPQNFNVIICSTLTYATSVVMHLLPTTPATIPHLFANLQALEHLNQPSSKDHHDPPLLQDPCPDALSMPT